jgi:F-type H+-transporting ATPase subunit delta
MPSAPTIGPIYAEALADAVEARGGKTALDEAGAWMEALGALWKTDRRLRGVFVAGSVPKAAKRAALDRLLSGRAPRLLHDFLRLLVERGRIAVLGDIATAFRAACDERLGRVVVHIWTATEVPPERLTDWTLRLKAALGADPIVKHRVRPELVAGAVIRAGDRLADGSARRRLNQLKHRILERGKHATQS